MKEEGFPKSFIKRMTLRLDKEFPSFLESLSQESIISVRTNPQKPTNQFAQEEEIPWNEHGYFLNKRPEFVFDPLIHGGAYYVQESSSMLFAHAIDFSKDLKILDLCASPGGKSTLLLSKMSKNSVLFSNELVGKRAEILKENLLKWGNSNIVVTSNRSASYASFNAFFDIVLVDAPCSGEGMFRKNNRALQEWSENKAFVCSIGQKDILDEAIKLVRNNGLLIYSTCTYSEEENDQIVKWFYKKYKSIIQPITIQLKDEWGVVKENVLHFDEKDQEVYRCYPHKIRGEGMFIAAFKVSSRMQSDLPKQKRNSQLFKGLSNIDQKKVNVFVKPNKDFQIRQHLDRIYALPTRYLNEIGLAAYKLNIVLQGTYIGSFNKKSGDFIPSHDLAMSNLMKEDFPFVELELKDALHYLKKMETSINPNNLPLGWIIAKYKGCNLGFLKNNKSRLSNFYPKEWSIRKNLPNWELMKK